MAALHKFFGTLFLFAAILAWQGSLYAKVRILTFHYNAPKITDIQIRALQKFVLDDFELIVFNDAKTEENEQKIEAVCKQYGVRHIRFEQALHANHPLNERLRQFLQEDPSIGLWGWNATTTIEEIAQNASVRHSHVLEYALEHYGYAHDDIVVILDGDAFPIQPVCMRDLLFFYDLVGVNPRADSLGANRKKGIIACPKNEPWLWVVFIAFNPSLLPSVHELHLHVDVLETSHCNPLRQISDTGAALYRYLDKHPELNVRSFQRQDSGIFRSFFSYQELKQLGFDDNLIRFIYDVQPGNVQFFIFEHFMHFAAISSESPDHGHKIDCLCRYMNQLLK